LREKVFTEEQAFVALIQEEEIGLDFFFNCYYSPLLLYSNSIIRNYSVAEEIASEAFVKLWKNKGTITDGRKVKSLLYKIIYNASIDHIRQERNCRQRLESLQISSRFERPILDKLIEVETHHQLYLLLQNLPPRSRQVFKMFYFQNKAVKEIAQELGISANTVKTHKQRAIQYLRQHQGTLYFLTALLIFFL
jgi:RNA polymerase sigma-70 factor (family 1)